MEIDTVTVYVKEKILLEYLYTIKISNVDVAFY